MDLTFERGDAQRPRGHALVYFRVDTEPDKLYASYIVVLPVKADFGKYVPPFLASHLGNLPLNDFSAFAMPPVPEEISGHGELERLSDLRGDDLVFGSSMFSFDLPRMMEGITDAVQSYSQLCADYYDRQGLAGPPPAAGACRCAGRGWPRGTEGFLRRRCRPRLHVRHPGKRRDSHGEGLCRLPPVRMGLWTGV